MKHPKIVVFCLALGAAVATAVISVGAQSRSDRPAPAPRPDPIGRGGLMMLDGRGSQLGVMVRDLEGDALAAAKGAGGVQIDEVTPESAAERAGLKPGDIVTEYDGERVRSARQFTRLVQETPEGRAVKIGVLRNGQRQTIEATPEARTFSWSMDIDGDRIFRDAERGMRNAFKYRFDEMLPQGFASSRGRLGITVESLSPQLGDYFGAKDGGALVSSVAKDSPAEKAGIKAGDVITSVNGDRVRDADDLVRELSAFSGTDVSIGLLRDKKETSVKTVLESRRLDRPRAPLRQVRPALLSRPA